MRISENYSLEKDKYQWVLINHVAGKNKKGEATMANNKTYHSNLSQVSSYLVNNQETHDLNDYIATANQIMKEMEGLLREISEAGQ